MATFQDFYNSLDADSGRRGKQFELFVKWFLKNEPEWSTQVEQVWLWDEYPGRWGADCGIDLVFKHKNGETWAVQAKCYSPQYSITKHDVDKFLSESNRNGISKRLLIASTDGIGSNAKQVCDAQDKMVVRYLLSNFETAEIEYPLSIEGLRSAKRKDQPKPRDHQIEAIEAVNKNFKNTDRGQLIMACGTGKTFTTLWIKENLESKSTLVLLPSLSLLSQTLKEWTFAASEPFDVLCVCSDQTVGKRGEDEIIHSVSDLAFPVTSNSDDIKQFINGNGSRVIFSTYQSSPLVAEAFLDSSTKPFDLIIADEAHRCAGKVSSDFSTVLDGERIRSKKRLFTTATPRTYNSAVKRAAEERGSEVVGMDDEAIFGKVLYSLPFGEAIKRELLTDYRLVIVGVDDPMIAAWIENRELVGTETGIESDAESLAAQIGLIKAIKDYDLKRVISFHSRVSRAETFSKEIHDVCKWIDTSHRPSGELWSDYVSGEMPTDKRRVKLDQLKQLKTDQRGLLTNARCLSEGVDVPSLDGVAFIDPRGSQVDIIQAVGRAIRLSKNKKFGTIILPVFIAAGKDAGSAIEASNFKPIWDVLIALKSHDDELSNELSSIRTELGRKKLSSSKGLTKIEIDLPSGLDSSFANSIRTILVEQTTASWDFWYGLLLNYLDEFGDGNVPQRYLTSEGLKLGTWCANQRKLYLSGELSKERTIKLEKIPSWQWSIYDSQWNEGFKELNLFYKANQNALVPSKYISESGFRLGQWVTAQRISKNENKLEADRKLKLETLPTWTWDVWGDQWHNGYNHLKDYVKENGTARISNNYKTKSGFTLGSWAAVQRRAGAQNRLSAKQIDLLNALPGFQWDVLAEQWNEAFEDLKKYIEKEGHARVPRRYLTPNGFKLGDWIGSQRSAKLKNTLANERVLLLESLPKWQWDVLNEQWDEAFEVLQDFIKQNGTSLVPQRYVTPSGFKLGWWIGTQRINKENNKLDTYKIEKLESLPGWKWDVLTDQWDRGYVELQEYVKLNGSTSVPVGFTTKSGFNLRNWVQNQRSNYRKSQLSEDRIAKLQKITEWKWDVLTDQWNRGYIELQDYVRLNGTPSVPSGFITKSGFNLGSWVSVQRRNKQKNIITEDNIQKLESLANWSWDAFADKWEIGFMHLEEYVSEFKTAKVPKRFVCSDDYSLGTWVMYQRIAHREGKLSLDRAERLSNLPDWIWVAN